MAYVKKNFLAGLDPSSLDAVNHAARLWLEQVANIRRHAETHQTPMELFLEEMPDFLELGLMRGLS